MALRLAPSVASSVPSQPISSSLSVAAPSSWSGCSSPKISAGASLSVRSGSTRRSSIAARCSIDMAVVTVGQVTEVDKDSFWPIVEAAGEKAVVLDMYTQWCGPCKIMAPKFQKLSEKYLDVVFLKLDCNQDNKLHRSCHYESHSSHLQRSWE
ncbi:hypothetical protein SAY86_028592 [Trapa natans]|uniref:Thioredoxin domain-containing protein n=1 Tax=Trapa natans TaxID=22666 RepID=A0AAN7MIL2_TRANT|nr:hypothetical protein SAY86_028592 [Trapa natans]